MSSDIDSASQARDLIVIPLSQEMLEFLRDQATDKQAGVLVKQALRRSPIKRIVEAEAKD